jgi:class 3 adenylate cyclase
MSDSKVIQDLPPLREGDLGSLSLVFRSRALEEEYWARRQPRMRQRTVVAVAVVLVLYGLFGILDRWIVPEVVMHVWKIRGAVLGLCVLLIALTRTRLFQRAHQLILLSLPILGGLGILTMVAMAGETGRLLYYAALILAIIWTMLFADLRFLPALGASVYLIFGYELIALFVRPLPLPVVINNTFFLVGALVMSAAAGYESKRAARVNFYQSLAIERERQRSEALLLNVLPREVSEILKTKSGTVARRYQEASILFADIVGFASLSARMGAQEMVELLNETFSYFDSLAERYGVEKIRTIGDNYMVVAGVIGVKKFQYDVWGDAVNAASRMESMGLPGEIQLTRDTYELLRGRFLFRPRGRIEVKGLGSMETWFLLGRPRAPAARAE